MKIKEEISVEEIEPHYNSTFKAVMRDEKCAFCPLGCTTYCLRSTNKGDAEQSKVTKDYE